MIRARSIPEARGLASGLVVVLLITTAVQAGELRAVPFQDVKIKDEFWSPRLETNRTVTALANLRQCEITGRLKNFAVAGKLEEGKHQGLLFNDSDVYKALEGIAYALANQRDPDLEKRADAIINQIAAAQQPDGYLNTYYTLVKPEERWKNTAHGHEMYCAGHLIEAGIAYQHATGKGKLLDVSRKFADHICNTFGPDKRIDVCGHEEIELALIKLYRATNDKKYLEQARFFLETRGRGDKRKTFGEYAQDHKPIREQGEVVGHAVRAMYLYCAIADLAAITGDKQLIQNLETIWDDVTQRKMYITGGIGSSASNEGFTKAYDLPNDTAYAETCAAVGLALWSQRMFLLTGDGQYADLVEREAYNGLLSGVSLSGDRFFYTNPLGTKSGTERVPWFACACCPPNVLRWIAGIGERVYAHDEDSIYTMLYMGNETTIPLKDGKVKLKQETMYPWTDSIFITVEPEKSFEFELCLRVPGWAKEKPFIRVMDAKGIDGSVREGKLEQGFLKIKRVWQPGDKVTFKLPFRAERVHADPKVTSNTGRAAIQRGPIVYCMEGIDNDGQVRNLTLPTTSKDWAQSYRKDLLGGVTVLRGETQVVSRGQDGKLNSQLHVFTAIPYFAWANRGRTPMVVWVPEIPELAELPGDDGVTSNGVHIRASHCYVNDKLTALNDGQLPKSSGDHGLPRMTWWDRRGSTEWVSYRYAAAKRVDSCAVYWFDDSGRGACRVPAEWRLLWLDGKDWKPVKLTGDAKYGTALDQVNRITFEPVTTRELRLEVQLKPEFSGGILEWSVAEGK